MKKLFKLVEPWQIWINPYPHPDDAEYYAQINDGGGDYLRRIISSFDRL